MYAYTIDSRAMHTSTQNNESPQWAIPFNEGTPPMDDRAICLTWDKNIVLTPLGQTVVKLRGITEIY